MRHVPGTLLVAAMAAGCQSNVQPATAITVEAVYAGAQCGAPDIEPGASWLSDGTELARFMTAAQRYMLNTSVSMPSVDFTREAVLVISMGTRPTAGYGLALTNRSARIVGTTLELSLVWQSPSRDTMVAQVLTSPCLLLRVPREGYETVHILDTAGRTLVNLKRR